MKNYEIKTVHHTGGREDTYFIYSTEEAAFFAGYDEMGSANWVKYPSRKYELTKADDPWQIVDDLEAADEEFDKKLDEIINDPELWEDLKAFMESIGCTNVKITDM